MLHHGLDFNRPASRKRCRAEEQGGLRSYRARAQRRPRWCYDHICLCWLGSRSLHPQVLAPLCYGLDGHMGWIVSIQKAIGTRALSPVCSPFTNRRMSTDTLGTQIRSSAVSLQIRGSSTNLLPSSMKKQESPRWTPTISLFGRPGTSLPALPFSLSRRTPPTGSGASSTCGHSLFS